MNWKRVRLIGLMAGGALALAACADDHYGGGYAAGYGYPDDGYGYPGGDGYGYDGGYGQGYGYDPGYGYAGGYGYDDGGWYGGFYYPGYGVYVFDRSGHRRGWSPAQRRYWEARRTLHRDNRGDVRDYRQDMRQDRRDYRQGDINRQQYHGERQDNRQDLRQDFRQNRRDFHHDTGRRAPPPPSRFRSSHPASPPGARSGGDRPRGG